MLPLIPISPRHLITSSTLRSLLHSPPCRTSVSYSHFDSAGAESVPWDSTTHPYRVVSTCTRFLNSPTTHRREQDLRWIGIDVRRAQRATPRAPRGVWGARRRRAGGSRKPSRRVLPPPSSANQLSNFHPTMSSPLRVAVVTGASSGPSLEIGRASCRERVS